ncbi:MAG: hypothetical protein J0H68_04930 [Sphingobacteriia bacterium]|nr:hypothetical protein [Sphingobacteriia bacterium]
MTKFVDYVKYHQEKILKLEDIHITEGPNTIRLYSVVSNVDLEVIQKEGLKSKLQLSKEGKVKVPNYNFFYERT